MKIYLLALLMLVFVAGCGGSGSDDNTEVTPPNKAPEVTLASSQQSVEAGVQFQLVASATDSDGNIVSYKWSQQSGPELVLPSTNSATLSLTAPSFEQQQTLVFRVEVTDNDNATAWSEASVTVNAVNQKPQVSIISSHATVMSGKEFELEAIAADPDGSIETYAWSQLSGPSVELPATQTEKLVVVAPAVELPQILRFKVEVADDDGDKASAEIAIEVAAETQLQAPYVWLQQSTVNLVAGDSFVVEAQAEDNDGQIVSYQWRQLSGLDMANTSTDTQSLNLVIPDLDIHQSARFEVTVTDNDGLTDSIELELSLFPKFNSKTIRGRTDGKGVDLVIVADGFQQDEITQLNQAAEQFASHFLQEPTIAVHKDAWNIHLIESVSQDSGASFPEDNVKLNTAFDAYFQCGGIYRLLCVNTNKVMDVTAKLLPQFDQIIVVVNSKTYGGSGGPVSVYSLADSASDIAIHELGHSFAGLADEYDYGSSDQNIFEPHQPNVTTVTDVSQLKWKHWVVDADNLPSQPGEQGVGLFEGAFYRAKNYYRPTDNSVMRNIGMPFGPINAEQWSLNVHRVASSVHSVAPDKEELEQAPNASLTFTIEPVFDQQVSEISWYINEQLQPSNGDFMTSFTVTTPPSSNYTVKVVVKDKTGLIRKDDYQIADFTNIWTINAL